MFYIAGDGPEKESIIKEIEKYGLKQRVKMLGNISEPHEFIGIWTPYFYYLFVKCFQW